jgi:flagellar biosynthetic protein FliQ
MTEAHVLDITRQALTIGLLVAAPVLAVALFVGLLVSVFQAITQVQELTLTYVPKLIAATVVIIALGSWMLSTMVAFTRQCFDLASKVAT